MRKIATGAIGSGSAIVLEIILQSLGLSGSVGVTHTNADLTVQTATYSFVRPSTIAAQTYPSQFQPVASISTQFVLASPVAKKQEAGEVGPGTAGVAAAVPIGANQVKKINDALNFGEVLDPAIPTHASLAPTIEVVDKSLPFRLDISLVNILMILFTLWVLYLCTLPSPRDFTMPDGK